ncbi:hypothetical protein AWB67_07612 [Caballeronia terrestris]|uniref:Uncharacterized protein n=1 Tax=Caballeronia terrestris TaxID=1226301 RepID=A0A158L5G2_9BURK|nr:hypothetical protein AWB67_07612 [Caballeronia terrestris]
MARLNHGSQARLERVGPIEIVEARYGNVGRHAHSTSTCREHDADCREVIAADQRGDRVGRCEQMRGGIGGRGEVGMTNGNAFLMDRKSAAAQSIAETFRTLQRGREVGLPCEEADPLVSMIDHVGHHRRKGLPVLDSDAVEVDIGEPVDHDRRDAMFAQVGQRAVIATARWRDDDPIDSPLVQRGHDLEFPIGVVLRVREKNHHSEFRAFLLDGVDDVGKVPVSRGRNSEADRTRGRSCQGSRHCVGRVTERANGVLDRSGRVDADEPRAIENMGNG